MGDKRELDMTGMPFLFYFIEMSGNCEICVIRDWVSSVGAKVDSNRARTD